jgi:hypothetical protein
MLKRSDDRASVAERRNVCARRSGAGDGLLFSLFVWLGASDRSWVTHVISQGRNFRGRKATHFQPARQANGRLPRVLRGIP